MSRKYVDVIIPTYKNIEQLQQAIDSIRDTSGMDVHFIIVNNNSDIPLATIIRITSVDAIITPGNNTGWTGGLAKGMEYSDSEFVVFANDDIFIPIAETGWLGRLLSHMDNKKVGAVGPSSNCVMGSQNIWATGGNLVNESSFLIGFCMLVRRKALDECGGVKPEWEHGDDIDLSIRIRSKGYGLVVDKGVFVFHHGFQTGNRLYGGPDKPGGWNSKSNIDETNMALIGEHGFLEWWNTMSGRAMPQLNTMGGE